MWYPRFVRRWQLRRAIQEFRDLSEQWSVVSIQEAMWRCPELLALKHRIDTLRAQVDPELVQREQQILLSRTHGDR